MHGDYSSVTQPKVSVITPSLNLGRFLRETIESVASQSYGDFEHIVIDGGSTDETLDILKEYPHVRYISEKDRDVVEAYQKGFAMARGEYIIQCCVSDGFLDKHWFRKCVDVLDRDVETALVWGFPQYMSEDGSLLNVSYQEFFNDPPPQKQEFLALWMANGFCFPEGNYCVRSEIIRRFFPNGDSEKYFQIHSHLGFMYQFMTQGYSPFFLPVVANFGRTHQDQRGQRLKDVEKPAQQAYFRRIREFRNNLLGGRLQHLFRDGRSNVIGEIDKGQLASWKRKMWRHRILRSRLLRLDPYTLVLKSWERFGK
ncbi:MAG: glycosyltransferase family 2 protein [Sulfuricaulis sp.]